MMDVFVRQPWVSVGMATFFSLSILIKTVVAIYYSYLNRCADNLSSTGNKVLKQCKLKFLNCCEMNDGISNVSVFVEKFLSRLKIGPFFVHRMLIWSGQMMLFSVICSGIGIYRVLRYKIGAGQVVPFYIACFVGIYVYLNFSVVIDVRGKRRILKVNLVDNLENHLSPRYHVTKKDCEDLYGDASLQTAEKVPARKRRETAEKLTAAVRMDEKADKQTRESTEQELAKLFQELFIG